MKLNTRNVKELNIFHEVTQLDKQQNQCFNPGSMAPKYFSPKHAATQTLQNQRIHKDIGDNTLNSLATKDHEQFNSLGSSFMAFHITKLQQTNPHLLMTSIYLMPY